MECHTGRPGRPSHRRSSGRSTKEGSSKEARMIPANFNYESPNTLKDALNLLSAHDDAKILAGGHSLLPATKFFNGMFSTALRNDEIITEVRVPKTTSEGVAYKKFHHPASGYAVVGVAVRLKKSGNKIETAAIGITGVSEIAYRANAVEN